MHRHNIILYQRDIQYKSTRLKLNLHKIYCGISITKGLANVITHHANLYLCFFCFVPCNWEVLRFSDTFRFMFWWSEATIYGAIGAHFCGVFFAIPCDWWNKVTITANDKIYLNYTDFDCNFCLQVFLIVRSFWSNSRRMHAYDFIRSNQNLLKLVLGGNWYVIRYLSQRSLKDDSNTAVICTIPSTVRAADRGGKIF